MLGRMLRCLYQHRSRVKCWFICSRCVHRKFHRCFNYPLQNVQIIWSTIFANEFNRIDTIIETIFNPCILLLTNFSHILGPVLVFIIILLLGSVLLIFYLCLLPQRYYESLLWTLWHGSLSHYLLVQVVYHYFKAAFTHPGRVPHKNDSSSQPLQWISSICRRCIAPRPPRAHHCTVCEECILCMDHHCPWINNCVGYRNHRHFYLLLVFLFIACIYAWFIACPEYRRHYEAVQQNANKVKPSDNQSMVPLGLWLHWFVACLLYLTGCLTCFIGALLAWHSRLVTRGETSIELHLNKKARLRFAKRGLTFCNPYDFGPLENWCRFLGLRQGFYASDFLNRVLLPSGHPPLSGGGDGTNFEMAILDCDEVLQLLRVV